MQAEFASQTRSMGLGGGGVCFANSKQPEGLPVVGSLLCKLEATRRVASGGGVCFANSKQPEGLPAVGEFALQTRSNPKGCQWWGSLLCKLEATRRVASNPKGCARRGSLLCKLEATRRVASNPKGCPGLWSVEDSATLLASQPDRLVDACTHLNNSCTHTKKKHEDDTRDHYGIRFA